MQKKTLFITYDGLLDPLGGSQIVPYLKGIAAHPRRVYVISFEKSARYRLGYEEMHKTLSNIGIKWIALRFTHSLGTAGKVWDLLRFYSVAIIVALRYWPFIVHARGHPAALVGLLLKQLFSLKMIFDFRGLWVDERVDKGSWELKSASHRLQYSYFKRLERKLIENSDSLVVLTEAVVPELRALGLQASAGLTVIPCCADFEHFRLVDFHSRAGARVAAEIPVHAFVLGYQGSIGLMYMIDRVLRLFELANGRCSDTYLLVVTNDVEAIDLLIKGRLPKPLHSFVRVRTATREKMPESIAAFDVLVCFILPSPARKGASPTKLAECFAAGIPVICNDGVGDVSRQVSLLGAGVIVDPYSDEALSEVVTRLNDISRMGGSNLRRKARDIFGLEVAAKRYRATYQVLE